MLGRFLRLFLAMLLCQIVILFLVLFGLVGWLASRGDVDTATVQSHSALWVQLSGELIEYPTLPTLPFLNEVPLSQSSVLECLARAAHDDKLDAVVLDLEFSALGWGMASELRNAVARCRAAGKPVWAFAPYLDEASLYLASACDSVFVPPGGKVMLNGFAASSMFFKGLFDKLGLHANVHRIGAYKSAAEPYMRSDLSDPARRNLDWLLDGLWEEFATSVVEDRELTPETFAAAVARGTLQPREAVQAHLIDAVRQRQDLVARFAAEDGEPRMVGVQRYRKQPVRPRPSGKAIAVVHTQGFILSGKNGYNPAVGTVLGDLSVVRDLEAAGRDDNVAAIVLRIDSPGGDALASDAIGHAVERATESKPVVVSMVDVAASGGYMMAYRASRIVALPTTLTGSIGSITGKLNVHGLYDKLGITKDFVTRGAYPLLWSDYHDWSAREESLVARQHWDDYQRWVADVAAHRQLTAAVVDSVARGRVWSGKQAADMGLVDELGDLDRAVALARELGGLAPSDRPRLVHYPKEAGLMDVLEERSGLLAALGAEWARSVRLPRGATWTVLDLQLEP